MSLVLIKSPEKLVNGHLSKWNAVHHPIIFQLQRQDQKVEFKIKTLAQNGVVKIKVDGTLPFNVLVGHRVYYSSPSQSFTVTITAIDGNMLTTDGTVSGTVYGGFVNFIDSFTRYFSETEIYTFDTSNNYVYIGTSLNKPSSDGMIKINCQEWAKNPAVYSNEFNFDAINKAINGEGGKLSIRTRENYNDVAQAWGNVFRVGYWVNASKQIGEEFGSNMGEFVPTYDNTREQKAKFLSVFNRPTYFQGFPFSISFIYSDNMLSYQLMRKEIERDINGLQTDNSSANLNISGRFFVNRLMISESYPSSVKSIDLWLETGSIVTESALNTLGDYTDGTVFQPLPTYDQIKTLG